MGKYWGVVTEVDAGMMWVKAGAAALTDASVGMCVAADGAPQGTVIVANTQEEADGL